MASADQMQSTQQYRELRLSFFRPTIGDIDRDGDDATKLGRYARLIA